MKNALSCSKFLSSYILILYHCWRGWRSPFSVSIHLKSGIAHKLFKILKTFAFFLKLLHNPPVWKYYQVLKHKTFFWVDMFAQI